MSEEREFQRVITSDGKVFEVATNVAKRMGFTKCWWSLELSERSNSGLNDANILPLDRIRSEVFQTLINWCNAMIALDERLDVFDRPSTNRQTLQRMLFGNNNDNSFICELIIAADYLGVPDIVQAATKYVAELINHSGSVETLRRRFNITRDQDEAAE